MKLSLSKKVLLFNEYSFNSSSTYCGISSDRYSSAFASSARTGPSIEVIVLEA